MPTASPARVVVASPIDTAGLAHHLDDPSAAPRGEGAYSVTRLVAGLLALQVPVTVVTCTRELRPGDEVVATGPLLRVRYGCWRGGPAARDLFRVEREHVRQAVDAEQVDLVHANWTYEYALGALDGDVPTLVTAHDWAPAILRNDRSPYRVVRLVMQAMALRRATHLIANSPYLAGRIERVVRRPVPYIGNPIDEAQFAPPDRLGPAPDPVLLAVNQGWGRLKNVTSLLRAFPAVRATHPTARLVLVGDGYAPDGPARALALKEGLAEGVEFVGRVDPHEVQAYMRRADVFVHPSREESFGNVLVEAMAQGTPTVGGSESGAVPWVLDHGAAGTLADVMRPDAIAQAVNALLDDHDHWRTMASAGHARAWDTFRTARIAQDHVDLYADVRRLTTIPQN